MADEPIEGQSQPPTAADPKTERREPEAEGPDDTANPRWWENQQGSGEVH